MVSCLSDENKSSASEIFQELAMMDPKHFQKDYIRVLK